ncbi:MAG: UDP-N-acetylglucosamine 2-epimerase (non-hydrolyzing) [Acidimicrobiaceae bacterium]|nr:UDP-N-acetylglucosamine 2-epimerase (non-hydrolyzing) [Acidimicrobiaceae bacterium]
MTPLEEVGTGRERLRRVLVAYGTRPEIVKLAPVVRTLRAAGHIVRVVNTGQHFSVEMNHGIAREVDLVADVDHLLPEEPAARLGALVETAGREVDAARTDVVLCLGDTETIPAYALAARRAGIPFWHLEAGLRSFNERSVEELIRRLAAAAASFNLAPTERARGFLLAEGVPPDRIAVVGNPIVDALVGRGLRKAPLEGRSGVLLTVHRATNVDDPARLARVVELANGLAEEYGSVRFPVHPRTDAMLERFGLGPMFSKAVERNEPLPSGDFLEALRRCSLAVTDSGGVQEEAAFFGVPVIVLRGSTPRWEGVDNGSVALVNLENPDAVAAVFERARRFAAPEEQRRIDAIACPYGDGKTSERVAGLLRRPPNPELLRLSEPGVTVPAAEQ